MFFLIFFGKLLSAGAVTCTLNGNYNTSTNPFGTICAGVDTIVINDTLFVNGDYTYNFDRVIILESAVIYWLDNYTLTIGLNSKLILRNGSALRPTSGDGVACNAVKRLRFGTAGNAPTYSCAVSGGQSVSFDEINTAGCVDRNGLCCSATLTVTDNAGIPNDAVLCAPDQSVTLQVLGSGTLTYTYAWSPNIGTGTGPYTVVPGATTNYAVTLSSSLTSGNQVIMLNCNASRTVTINPAINLSTAVVNPVACDPTGTITLTVSGGTAPYTYLWSNAATTQNLSGLAAGTYTVTVTDARGCTATTSATIIVVDNQPPMLSCPANKTVNNTPGLCTGTTTAIDAVFSDNCPGAVLTYTIGATTASGNVPANFAFPVGMTTVTYRVVDAGMNSVSCSFTVTVTDNEPPTAPNPPALSGITCTNAIPMPNPAVVTGATDNCGAVLVMHLADNTVTPGMGCPGDPLVIQRVYRVMDNAGNSSTVTQSITVIDNVVPTWTTLAGALDTTLSCSDAAGLAAAQLLSPSASDNCTMTLTLFENAGSLMAGMSCPQAGTITTTWTARDQCSNESTPFTQTITVQDTTAPTWSTLPNALNATVQCNDANALQAAQNQAPVATDNCDNALTPVKMAGAFVPSANCPQAGTYTNTWTVTDDCGNVSGVFTQIITVEDTQAPTWSTALNALDATVQCSDVAALATAQAAVPVATDNCDNALTPLKMAGAFVPSANCAQAGTYTNTWTVTDDCGNVSAIFTQIITVEDTQAPTWSTALNALNATVQCSDVAAQAAAQAAVPVATDNCDNALTPVKVPGAFVPNAGCAYTGTYTNTWTVTDDCGNVSAVFTQIITVEDTQVPTWSTMPNALNVTVQCNDVNALQAAQNQAPVATDNCDQMLTPVKMAGAFVPSANCPQAGTYTNTWTVTDDCGNVSAVFTQVITVEDTQAPTWSTLPDALNATVQCNDANALQAAQNQAPAATDNCDQTLTPAKIAGAFVPSANCPQAGTYTNTWTVTDDCGNVSAIFTQIITVEDTQAPTWSTAVNALNATVECSDVTALATAQAAVPVATDNCDNALTPVKMAGAFVPSANCPQAGTYTNTWTVTDDCGNVSAIFTQIITVEDTQAPTWSTALNALNATVQCSDVAALATAQAAVPAATDNCDNALTPVKVPGAFVPNAGCAYTGTYTNTWTVTDDCGNVSAVFTQIITIEDTQVPTWSTMPNALNVTVQCNDVNALQAAQNQAPVATDNCDQMLTPVKIPGAFVPSANCPQAGTYTNTFTVTDDCGNVSAVFTQVITVEDTQAPTWSTLPDALNATVQCNDANALQAAQNQAPAATDNCDQTLTPAKIAGAFVPSANCPQAGTYTNTWTVTDDCGNVSAIFTQIITVEDTQVPTWSTAVNALNATVQCSDVAALATAQAAVPVATDNCDIALTPVKMAGAFVPSANCPQAGTYTNTWTVTDDCGNVSAIFTQIITVEDTQAPTWSTALNALNATVQCSDVAALAAAQAAVPVATDNCDNALTPVKVPGAFVPNAGCAYTGTYTNTWTVTDDCGNVSAVFTQVITVEDTQVPTWSTMSNALNVTVQCNDVNALQAAQNQAPVATDNCDQMLTPVKMAGAFVPSANCPQAGTYTNTFTVTDDCGNVSAVFTQVITVEDTQAPTWSTMPNALNATVQCNDANALQAAQNQAPAATDNCAQMLTPVKMSGAFVPSANCPQAGTYTNTWTVTDDCGNVSGVFTQITTVEDTQAPTWSTASGTLNTTVACDNPAALAAAQALAPAAVDNCTAQPVVVKTAGAFVAGSCPQAGTYTNTWTATDACGNASAVFTQIITVVDNQAPTWTTPAGSLNATVACNDAAALAAAQALAPLATDNCDGALTPVKTAGPFQPGCGLSGTVINTWTVTDDCGNVSAVFTQTITVTDASAPTIITPAGSLDAMLECSNAAGLAAALALTPTGADDCGLTPVPQLQSDVTTPGACAGAYVRVRTWRFSDACGNISAPFTQTITVKDQTAPVWSTAPGALNQGFSCGNTAALQAAQALVPVANDNCDPTLTPVKTAGPFVPGNCAGSGTYTNTWTVTDDCGNVSNVYTQTITLVDNQPPTWTTASGTLNQTVSCSDPNALAAAQTLAPNAQDNCSPAISVVKTSGAFVPGNCAGAGTYTNTWIATDACGNASPAFVQIITLTDTQAPTWTTAPGSLHITVPCNDAAALAAAQALAPVATDNCAANLSVVKTAGAFVPTCGQAGTFTNTWITTDPCGNMSAVFTQIITIQDQTAPTWSTLLGALDATVACNDLAGLAAAQALTPSAVDNCSATVNIVKTSGALVPGNCPNTGTYTNTWVATDACGNASLPFTQVIVVNDVVAPQWLTPVGSLHVSVACSDPAALAAAQALAPQAIDQCGGPVTIVKTSGAFLAGACAQTGTYTNTWTVTDVCGNTSPVVFTQIITVTDNVAPGWTTVAGALDVQLTCNDPVALAAAQALAPAAQDNCSAAISIVKTTGVFVPSATCPQNGTYTNTWIATDACGNASTLYTQTITVADTTAPQWSTAPGALDRTIPCAAPALLAAAQALVPAATDNCGGILTPVKSAGTLVSGSCPQTGTITNTWTVSDGCNNVSAVYTQVISVVDTTAPVWTTPANAFNITVNCHDATGLAGVQALQPAATDNCTNFLSVQKTAGAFVPVACPQAGTYTNTFVTTDACGNTSPVFTQIITIVDNDPPVWSTAPGALNQTVICGNAAALTAAQALLPVATDNCAASLTAVKTAGPLVPGACAGTGTYTNTFTVNDGCGNTAPAVYTQTITVVDNTAPTWTTGATALNVTLGCKDTIGLANAQSVAPIATDNCSTGLTPVKTTGAFVPGNCPEAGSYTNTWTVTDACGNVSAVFTQIIQIGDNAEPEWSTTAGTLDVTIGCNDPAALAAAQALQPTATDECSMMLTVTKAPGQLVPGTCPGKGTYTNTWIATDGCSNSSTTFIQIITVTDTLPPVWSTPAGSLDVAVSCSDVAGLQAAAALSPVATDNCTGSLSAVKNTGALVPGSCPQAGTYTHTWTVTDGCGLAATPFVQVITVIDTTSPTLTCPANISITMPASLPVTGLNLTPTVTDNCGTAGITYALSGATVATGANDASGEAFNAGATTVTYTATDSCGNIASCSFVVQVEAPDPLTLFVNSGEETCGDKFLLQVQASNFTNVGSAQFSLTWDPQIMSFAAASGFNPDLGIDITNFGTTLTADGKLGFSWVTPDPFAGSSVPDSAVLFQVLFIASNAYGQSTAISFGDDPVVQEFLSPAGQPFATQLLPGTFTVLDLQPPMITCPADVFVSVTTGCDTTLTLPAVMAEDFCSGIALTTNDHPDNVYPVGQHIVTFTATDFAGNTASCSVNVGVTDQQPPVLVNCPLTSIIVEAPDSACSAVATWASLQATDLCSTTPVSVQSTATSGQLFPVGITEVLVIATDAAGNTATCLFNVEVRDVTPPTVQCPADVEVPAGANCQTQVDFAVFPATDNCATAPVVSTSHNPGSVFPAGVTVVTFEASDASGNTATCTFSVTVSDQTPPAFTTCPVDFTVPGQPDTCGATVTWIDPLATDDCGTVNPLTSNIAPGTFLTPGDHIVVYTATDGAGLTATCSFTVTVTGNVAPVWNDCPANIMVNAAADCAAVVSWDPPAASAACGTISTNTNYQPGDTFSIGTTVVEYIAENSSGTQAVCAFEVTVVDATPPVLGPCPADSVVVNAPVCGVAFDWVFPGVSDNCPGNLQLTANPAPGDTLFAGTTIVTMTATDNAGLTTTCMFSVTVQTVPFGLAGVPGNQTTSACNPVFTWTPPVPIGNCGPVSLSANIQPGDTLPVGDHVVTYTATDLATGQTATANFTLTVQATTAPTFVCPTAPITVSTVGSIQNDPIGFIAAADPTGTCADVQVDFGLPAATDPCGTPVVTQTAGLAPGAAFAAGTHVLTFQAVSAGGASSQCSVTIEVVGIQALTPVVDPPVACEGSTAAISVQYQTGVTYTWTGPQGTIQNSNFILIPDLSAANAGPYTVVATVDGCSSTPVTVSVQLISTPVATDDQLIVGQNELGNINVLTNDTALPSDAVITLRDPVPAGLTPTGAGAYAFQAGEHYGTFNVVYDLCSATCPSLCDAAVLALIVRDDDCEFLPNAITPNGDGLNDVFAIPCLDFDAFPNNQLTIFNQWGDKVFEAAPYKNDPDKAWNGRFMGQDGAELPDATYYYIFQPAPGVGVKKGFVEIFR